MCQPFDKLMTCPRCTLPLARLIKIRGREKMDVWWIFAICNDHQFSSTCWWLASNFQRRRSVSVRCIQPTEITFTCGAFIWFFTPESLSGKKTIRTLLEVWNTDIISQFSEHEQSSAQGKFYKGSRNQVSKWDLWMFIKINIAAADFTREGNGK